MHFQAFVACLLVAVASAQPRPVLINERPTPELINERARPGAMPELYGQLQTAEEAEADGRMPFWEYYDPPYPCHVRNSSHTLVDDPCLGDFQCNLGPVTEEVRGSVYQITMCARPGRYQLFHACEVQGPDGYLHRRRCPMENTCSLGPFRVQTEGKTVSASYCSGLTLRGKDWSKSYNETKPYRTCRLEDHNGNDIVARKCPKGKVCTAGPYPLKYDDMSVRGFFCEKPDDWEWSLQETVEYLYNNEVPPVMILSVMSEMVQEGKAIKAKKLYETVEKKFKTWQKMQKGELLDDIEESIKELGKRKNRQRLSPEVNNIIYMLQKKHTAAKEELMQKERMMEELEMIKKQREMQQHEMQHMIMDRPGNGNFADMIKQLVLMQSLQPPAPRQEQEGKGGIGDMLKDVLLLQSIVKGLQPPPPPMNRAENDKDLGDILKQMILMKGMMPPPPMPNNERERGIEDMIKMAIMEGMAKKARSALGGSNNEDALKEFLQQAVMQKAMASREESEDAQALQKLMMLKAMFGKEE